MSAREAIVLEVLDGLGVEATPQRRMVFDQLLGATLDAALDAAQRARREERARLMDVVRRMLGADVASAVARAADGGGW